MMHWILIYVFISFIAIAVYQIFGGRRIGALRLSNIHRCDLRNQLAQEYTAMSAQMKKLGAADISAYNQLLNAAFLGVNLPLGEQIPVASFYDSMQPWLIHQKLTHDLQYDLWIDPALHSRTIGLSTSMCIQKAIYEVVPLLSTGHPISIYFKNMEGIAQLHLLHPELTINHFIQEDRLQKTIYRLTTGGLILDDENNDGWIISGI